jgi:hydroxymethylbilane synthase
LLKNFPDKFSEEEDESKRKIEIKVIKSTGDMILDKPLEQVGGKGVFTKELDIALLNEDVAICVHSMKDVPTDLVPKTVLPCNLVRETTNDVWISSETNHPRDLPDGAVIGTASLRRQAQLKRMARAKGKSVRCENFRGNVQSRMMKIFEKPEAVNSTMLALAGIKRMEAAGKPLGVDPVVLPWKEMLPAVAQGAIGIQCREGDEETLGYLAKLNHADTKAAVDCERAFLRGLDGNCKTPIGGQAWIENGKMHFWGLVLRADGSKFEEIRKTDDAEKAVEIGEAAAKEVKEKIGDVFDFIGEYEVLDERAKDSLGKADGLGGYISEKETA